MVFVGVGFEGYGEVFDVVWVGYCVYILLFIDDVVVVDVY